MKNVQIHQHNVEAIKALNGHLAEIVELFTADGRFKEGTLMACGCGTHVRIAAKDVAAEVNARTALTIIERLTKAWCAADEVYDSAEKTDIMYAVKGWRDGVRSLYVGIQMAIEDAMAE